MALGQMRQGAEEDARAYAKKQALLRGEDPSKYDERIYFRKEAILEQDLFNKPAYRENLESLAQVIQNLIVMPKGCNPNDPRYGVGIEQYLWEFADNITTTYIQHEIEDQITRYVAHPYSIVTVNVSAVKDKNLNARKTVTTLLIKVNISGIEDGDTAIELDYAVSLNHRNKRFVSSLIYS